MFLVTLKWCRITLLLSLLVVIILGLFLDHVGLPDWLEKRIEDQVRAKGWEMKFSRLRLRWYRGIVAEDLQLQRVNGADGPHLFVRSMEFRLNWKAVRDFDLQASGALLSGGRLVWPLPGTNSPQRTLVLDEIGGELIFHPSDLWELKFLEARFLGTQFRVRGGITHASLLRDWQLPEAPESSRHASALFWHRFLRDAERLRFIGRPELNVLFAGDARDLTRSEASLKFIGLGLQSPWASGTNVLLTARLLPPPRAGESFRVDLQLSADHAEAAWGRAAHLNLDLVLEPSTAQWLPTNSLAQLELKDVQSGARHADSLRLEFRSHATPSNNAVHQTRVDLGVEGFSSPQAGIRQARVAATALHAATNLFPAPLETTWTLHEVQTPWLTSHWARAEARVDLPALDTWRIADTRLPWPERLRTFPFRLTTTLSNATAPAWSAEGGRLTAHWRPPELQLEAEASQDAHRLSFRAGLNADTRQLAFETDARVDPVVLTPLLPKEARGWLVLTRFGSPPRLRTQGRCELPPWTNASPDWAGAVLASLAVTGRLTSDAGACHDVPFASSEAAFSFTNQILNLPAVTLMRPEGGLELSATTDLRTGDFSGTFRSRFDLLSLRPVFPEPPGPLIFDFFQFTVPPWITGTVRGSLRDFDQFSAQALVAVTNAVFRGQSVDTCVTRVSYTNLFLSILEPRVTRSGEEGQASGLGIDFALPRLYFTNASGTIAPRAITRAVGVVADRAIEPFVFDLPPASRANGSLPLGAGGGAEDMRFDVDGGPFHWLQFNLDRVKASVLWRGQTLAITNVTGRWQGGDVDGWAYFDFTPRDADVFGFQLKVEGAELSRILHDLQPLKDSKVEGLISGTLNVTRANSRDPKSWQGYGEVQLTNGLLWDLPLFGVFSPVLNTFVPGLGNSRARHAAATYLITNSVIHTEEMVIHATAMRMKYQGWVDFDQRVDGRMEAELLRDLPALGYVISKVLWPVTKLFEYKITGTLDDPKTTELFFMSKILTIPLHPIKSFKELLSLDERPETPPTPVSPPPKPPEPGK